jgi:hypothetical protein
MLTATTRTTKLALGGVALPCVCARLGIDGHRIVAIIAADMTRWRYAVVNEPTEVVKSIAEHQTLQK